MPALVTPFSIHKKDGAGWVSSRLHVREAFNPIWERGAGFLRKALWAISGIVALPFLHPIFTRFLPLKALNGRAPDGLWLNYSQTFGLAAFSREAVLVCHDLQCHCRHRLRGWVRWSEGWLLNRAKRVLVLSARDAKLVHRYYRIPNDRIENLALYLLAGLHPFARLCQGVPCRVAFLGSLARRENREGLLWFAEQVLPHCPDLRVAVVGQVDDRFRIDHSRLDYLGFVDDLEGFLAKQDCMIAPLFSKAGIKIKVVESLMNETPVLGTIAAYGGLPRAGGGWASNRPEDWIRILREGEDFRFPGLTLERGA